MERRDALRIIGIGSALGLGSVLTGVSPAAAQSGVVDTGTDLSGWQLFLGDGLYAGPGQEAPTIADLAMEHYGDHSVLAANIYERGIMAHGIAAKRITDPAALAERHVVSAEFRLPVLPTTSNWDYNAQTVEGGFFIWDGADTRRDYGLAFQWVVNPWVPNVGEIQVWRDDQDGQRWQSVGKLALDTEWHTVTIVYEHAALVTEMWIDGRKLPTHRLSRTPKAANWGNTVDARFQLEIISVWPGDNPSVPGHRAEFRNWSWTRTPV